MPLKIQIKAGQQIIINGAVIENASARTVSLLVKNEAAILRGDDVLSPESATTPAGRLYYALQCLYLFPEAQDRYLPVFKDLADSFLMAAPSSRPIIEAIQDHVRGQQYYVALKKARELIEHEGKVLSDAQQRFSTELRGTSGAGQSPEIGGLGPFPGGLAHEGEPGAQ